MPFDSEGNFTRVHNWDEDRQNDIDIASDRMDAEFDNYATALNDCVLRDGRATLIGDLDLGTFKIKNMAKGNNPQDAVNREQLDELRTQVFSGDNTPQALKYPLQHSYTYLDFSLISSIAIGLSKKSFL
jgi:hypothetical protein